MTLTEVRKDKKHCFKISTDDGRTFFIDNDVCAEYGIRTGTVIDEEKLEEITVRSDFVRARERALWYLDRSAHSEKALYQKLVRAGFAEKSCAEVMQWLKEYGMVDDRGYAEDFCERCSESNISKREACRKLILKGVDRELAKEITDGAGFDEQAQIRALIEKKYRSRTDSRENIQKIYAALIRKGFSYAAVRDVLKQYSEEMQYISEE